MRAGRVEFMVQSVVVWSLNCSAQTTQQMCVSGNISHSTGFMNEVFIRNGFYSCIFFNHILVLRFLLNR